MGSGKSEYAKKLDEAILSVVGDFRSHGFRKRGRDLYRVVDGDMTQIIGFSLGWYTQSVYGSFTMDAGLYFPDIAKLLGPNNPSKAVGQKPIVYYDCQFRFSHDLLTPNRRETWWPLDGSVSEAAEVILQQLLSLLLPFLNLASSRERIVEGYDPNSESSLYRCFKFEVAVLAKVIGRQDQTERILRDYLKELRQNSWFTHSDEEKRIDHYKRIGLIASEAIFSADRS